MRRVVPVLVSALFVSSCGALGSVNPAQEETPSVAAPTPTDAVSTSPAAPPTEPTSEPTTPTGSDSEPDESSSPIVTPTSVSGEQRLTLSDAFDAGRWREADFTRAGQATPQPAIQATISCYSSSPETIEMRFAQPTGRLDVDVAQAMDAPSSGESIEFALTTDGRQADSKTIPFQGVATLSAPLSGVTVVHITAQNAARASGASCSDDTSALITRLVIVH